jgi:hypothetical protein
VRDGPTWTQWSEIRGPGDADTELGHSVALDGERAVVGSPGDRRFGGQGLVRVHDRTPAA